MRGSQKSKKWNIKAQVWKHSNKAEVKLRRMMPLGWRGLFSGRAKVGWGERNKPKCCHTAEDTGTGPIWVTAT